MFRLLYLKEVAERVASYYNRRVVMSKMLVILLCSLFLVGCNEYSRGVANFDIQLKINSIKTQKAVPRCVRDLVFRDLQIEACNYIWEDYLTESEKFSVKVLRERMR